MSIIDDLKPSTTHFNPVNGKPYPLQVANPHTNVDVIHSAVESTAGDAGISTLLYDFVPSYGSSITVEHVDDQTMQSFDMYYTEPHPSGQGVTFPATADMSDYQHVIVPITNLTVGATVYVAAGFYQTPFPNPLTYTVQETGEEITNDYGGQITFVATETTHYLQLLAFGVHDEFAIHNVSATTIDVSKDTCTPFLRTIKDGATTDTGLDGKPYTVVGEVRTSCPDAQTEPACTCADELQALKASVDRVAALFETKYISPEYSYHTHRYIVMNYYKSLTVTFINDGTINGEHAPAGYSFTHPREVDVTYLSNIELDGTGFAVWEVR